MSSETLNRTGAFSQAKDLKNRILFTILLLIVYRLGTYVALLRRGTRESGTDTWGHPVQYRRLVHTFH